MIQVQVSNLSSHLLYNQLKDVHKRLKDLFDNLDLPIFDPYKEVALSPPTRATLFEYLPVECEHFGSADSFYSALCILNYFVTSIKYFDENKIDFNAITVKSEDLIILNSFKLFKEF